MANTISVIVPVYNSARYLAQCLTSLAASTVPVHECIVVDDGSTDDSAETARSYGARVLATGGRSGPAHARNIGAENATGDILFFLDADVCVQPGTVAKVAEAFAGDPELDALIGSYDTTPAEPDFLSQYRNLMHCFVHHHGRREASTFWTGCGAVRREVFLRHGGFSRAYQRPAIEDIELGYRMRRAGCRMVLDPDIQVKHLKRWTFWGLVKTDILDRGIPWTELILSDGHMPNDLNLQLSQRVSVALVYVLVLTAMAGAALYGGAFLLPLFAALLLILSTFGVETAFQTGSRTGMITFGLAMLTLGGLAWWHEMPYLVPPLAAAYMLLFLRHRYAYEDRRRRRLTGVLWSAYAVVTLLLFLTYLPRHPLVFAFFVLLLVLIVLNGSFYMFLARRLGWLYGAAAVPFHLLYHFYNGLSFCVGFARHRLGFSPAPSLPPGDERRRGAAS